MDEFDVLRELRAEVEKDERVDWPTRRLLLRLCDVMHDLIGRAHGGGDLPAAERMRSER